MCSSEQISRLISANTNESILHLKFHYFNERDGRCINQSNAYLLIMLFCTGGSTAADRVLSLMEEMSSLRSLSVEDTRRISEGILISGACWESKESGVKQGKL